VPQPAVSPTGAMMQKMPQESCRAKSTQKMSGERKGREKWWSRSVEGNTKGNRGEGERRCSNPLCRQPVP
jgi:hypothetical protein